MNLSDRILVLGARGMVGSAISRKLKSLGYLNVLVPSHQELDLLNQQQTLSYFEKHRPKHVFMTAAKVGGIHANNTYRADFIIQNLQIQSHAFEAALKFDIEKFQFLGSSCIYPRDCAQPMKENSLLTMSLEPTNEPYAVAKIAGLKTAENIRRQYGKMYFSVMPTNLYGENDNYHPQNSHVIPGLIQRMHKAKENNEKEFEIWGTGQPLREFLYVDDLADACVFLMRMENSQKILPYWLNVGSGSEISIRGLAETLAKVMEYQGKLVFNEAYPDGTPRKLMDSEAIRELGWEPKIDLETGLRMAVDFYFQKLKE